MRCVGDDWFEVMFRQLRLGDGQVKRTVPLICRFDITSDITQNENPDGLGLFR